MMMLLFDIGEVGVGDENTEPGDSGRSDSHQVTHSAEAPMYTKNIQQAQARHVTTR